MKKENETNKADHSTRRGFIRQGGLLVASSAIIGLSGTAISCNNKSAGNQESGEKGKEMVSVNEDLMREHGLLQRMLLIYDAAITRIDNNEDFNPEHINQTAVIIRDFIEDYHERLEEGYLFPRLEKANRLTELTATLRRQHVAGRQVTGQILELSKERLSTDDKQTLIELLQIFNSMYRPHEAWEDTVLFPAFKEVISKNEYDSLGEEFEKIEHQKFGEGGFDSMVDKVAQIEKQINIFELDQYTPKF